MSEGSLRGYFRYLKEFVIDQKIYRTALEAAKKKFSPEFMNRIDKVVVFRTLKRQELCQVLDLELSAVQRRIDQGARERFSFTLTDGAKRFLLAEGTEYRYGARHLKRAIERFLVNPLASLSASGQVRLGDMIIVDINQQAQRLTFFLDDAAVRAGAEPLELVQAIRENGQFVRVAA